MPAPGVAPNACPCGDLTVGPRAPIVHGAQVIAEGGAIVIGVHSPAGPNARLAGRTP